MTFIKLLKNVLLLSLVLSFNSSVFSQSLESKIDHLLSKNFNPNSTGISVLVAKEGKPIYQKAYGLANLELEVLMTPNHVFEIGSITKQFTAISILMLEEQGKLSLDDDITKYIPDYPTHGNSITIHHLLNHTSGIKSYTSIRRFRSLIKTDLSPKEIIDAFKNEPANFNPGDEYSYSNSGYIILGYIIEKITNQSYETFIQKNIFDIIDMSSSYYGSKTKIIKNRVNGYKKSGKTFANADYLSMTIPYAAGSLMSTTGDLLKWQNALNNNTLISKESFQKAANGSKLNNGTHIPYGYGLHRKKINGSESIEHGGSIFGFKSMGIYLPEEKIFVSALSNCGCKSPTLLTKKIAALAIGKPIPEIEDSIHLNEEALQKWTGTYMFDKNTIRHITTKANKIFNQTEGKSKKRLYPLSSNTFIFKSGFPTYEFSINKEGKKELKIITDDKTHVGYEINKAPPSEEKEIKISSDTLEKYIGKYQLQPDFIITVTTEGSKIFGQATNQPKFRLFSESETKFFLKAVKASIDFNKNSTGAVTSLTLHQNGKHIKGEKIE